MMQIQDGSATATRRVLWRGIENSVTAETAIEQGNKEKESNVKVSLYSILCLPVDLPPFAYLWPFQHRRDHEEAGAGKTWGEIRGDISADAGRQSLHTRPRLCDRYL